MAALPVPALVRALDALALALVAVDRHHEDQEKQGSTAKRAEIDVCVKKIQNIPGALSFPQI